MVRKNKISMLDIDISKIYEDDIKTVEAIKNIKLKIKEREFVVFVGSSGCGKTTLLKCVAGIIKPTKGEIVIDEQTITKPNKNIGMIFQEFSLFPWLTVRKNIEFGLKIGNIPLKERTKIVKHYLNITGLREFADAYPKSLSGGMKQRVAIARTLANNPKVILMDEPFGSLDSQTRSKMQEFLTKLWEDNRKTILFVTHDVEEAIFLADTVYLLSQRPAKIKQVFKVPFNRPRLHELKYSQEFFELEKEISKKLES